MHKRRNKPKVRFTGNKLFLKRTLAHALLTDTLYETPLALPLSSSKFVVHTRYWQVRYSIAHSPSLFLALAGPQYGCPLMVLRERFSAYPCFHSSHHTKSTYWPSLERIEPPKCGWLIIEPVLLWVPWLFTWLFADLWRCLEKDFEGNWMIRSR